MVYKAICYICRFSLSFDHCALFLLKKQSGMNYMKQRLDFVILAINYNFLVLYFLNIFDWSLRSELNKMYQIDTLQILSIYHAFERYH